MMDVNGCGSMGVLSRQRRCFTWPASWGWSAFSLLSDETAVAATVSGGSISDWVLKHYGSRLLTAPTAMSSSTFYSGLVLVGRPCVAGYLPDEDWFPDDGRVFWARCTLLSLR